MNQNDDPKQCKVYQFWEFLFDLLKNSRVVTSVKYNVFSTSNVDRTYLDFYMSFLNAYCITICRSYEKY